MAHVQRAGDIRRRDNDRKDRRVRILINLRRKIPIPLPPLIVVLLGLLRVVLFRNFHADYRQCFVLLSENERVESTSDRQQSSKTASDVITTLEKTRRQRQTPDMTNKEIVQDLLRRIPDDASLQDIARELDFIAAVRQGLAELDNGESVPIDQVEQELPSWIIK
jgi:hypothetical protein